MAKTQQKNFRLSDTALANLDRICKRSGINETAAVEIALAALAQGLTHEAPSSVFARYQADFRWDAGNLVWCLSGTDAAGRHWGTGDREARSRIQAESDAAQYLLESDLSSESRQG